MSLPRLDDVMNIQYTSGTTGMPKGAIQTHRFWLTFSRTGAAQFLDRARRILISQPFYYLDAQWLTLCACWVGGVGFVARRMHSSRFLNWMRTYQIQYCNFPEILSRQPQRDDDYMDHLVAMSCYSHRPENYPHYEQRYGGLARQGLSMTELACALYVPMEATEMTGSGSVGIPTAFRETMIADQNGQPVSDGERGELCVRGAGIFRHYHDKPQANELSFHPGGWFRTGDLASRNSDGWHWYLGRIKDMVRRSSENISAVEVEYVLRAVPGILEAAVLPVPDDLRGEEVKAYLRVEQDSVADEALILRVLDHCSTNLARFKDPQISGIC
jgi:crotonobetaine/carnitine-CoA ligase